METNFKTEIEKLRKGCGKEFTIEGEDYECGDDFPDDDGIPWCVLCPECDSELKALTQAKQMVKDAIDELTEGINDLWRGERDYNFDLIYCEIDEFKAKLGVQDDI